ncbi:hypothetical protein MNV84_06312 [Leishmania braziliensis]|nr:hypothetical protein MNV84_06312 [Leishmania braziliensis]
MKKQCRLQTVYGGGVMGYRHVARTHKDSIYTGLVPSSRSTKQQLAAADEKLYKRLTASYTNNGSTNSALQHRSATSVSSGVASRKTRSGNSTYLPTYGDARQRCTVEDLDDDVAAAAASEGTAVGLRESSAVLLQTLDTLQTFTPKKDNGHCNGESDDSQNRNGDTSYPTTAAAAVVAAPLPMPETRGPPSRQKSAGDPSSAPSSCPTRITAGKPLAKGGNANAQCLRKASSFRHQRSSRPSRSESRPGSSVIYVGDLAEVEQRHRPIRRLSSSQNLPVTWICPPTRGQRQRSGRVRSAKGNSRPQSFRAPPTGSPAAQAHAPLTPYRPSSTTTPHKRQNTAQARSSNNEASLSFAHAVEKTNDERRALQYRLHNSRASFSCESEPAMPQVVEGHLSGGVPGHGHGNKDSHQLLSHGSTAQLPELPTQHPPSTPSQHAALSAVPPTLDEVLQRRRVGVKAQPRDPSAAVPHSSHAAYSRSGDGWSAAPRLFHQPSGSALYTSGQHPYYVPKQRQQRLGPNGHTYGVAHYDGDQPHPATDVPNDYKNNSGGGEGFLPALRQAEPSYMRPAGGPTARRWRAPVPPAERHAFVELFDPLVGGSVSPTLPHQPKRPQQQSQRHPQQPTVELFRSSHRRRRDFAEVKAAPAWPNASPIPEMSPQMLPQRQAKADVASSEPEDMVRPDLDGNGVWAASHGYPAVAPPRTTAAAGNDACATRAQKRQRNIRKAAERNKRLYHTFAPYMASLRTVPGAGGRVRAVQPKTKKSSRLQQHRGNGSVRSHRQPVDYASLAVARDSLDHLLSRHGFWGEAMTRC